MKKWLLLLPPAATAAAVWLNIPGFLMGGPRAGWELAVTAAYLAAWICPLLAKPEGWHRAGCLLWWMLTLICSAACFCVVAFDWDGFLLMFPALGLITPLSGLAVLTGTNYPVFYGLCAITAAAMTVLSARRKTAE